MAASVAIIHQPALLAEDDITHDVIRGLASEHIDVVTYSVAHAHSHLDELDNVDGMLFGSFNTDTPAGSDLDAFFHATSERDQHGMWRDKIATAFTHSLELCADSLPLMLQFSMFSARHNMVWIDEARATPSSGTPATYPESRTTACESSPGFAFGQRVAQITKQWLAH